MLLSKVSINSDHSFTNSQMTELPSYRIEMEPTGNKHKSSRSKLGDNCQEPANSNSAISHISSDIPPPPPPALPYPPAFADDEFKIRAYQLFLHRANVPALLPLAVEARGCTGICSFVDWQMGSLNFAITIQFDDGVEWIIKAPLETNETSLHRMGSEVATLLFLRELDGVPAPKMHAYSLRRDNDAKTPYIMMEKVKGVTFGQAVGKALSREGVFRTLEGLARVRTALQTRPFKQFGSLQLELSLVTTDYRGRASLENGSPPKRGYFVTERGNLFLCELGDDSFSESRRFYLAHTDLNVSNVMVDPSDGTLLGIIDWEFANTLPPQTVEQYPGFLAEREQFVAQHHMLFDDASAELDIWRGFYNEQFEDEETRMFNSGILDMLNFEYLLRHPNDHPIPRILDAVESVVAEKALVEPLADVPWDKFHAKSICRDGRERIDGKSMEGFRRLHIPPPTIREHEITGVKEHERG
jgi:hypothetical protein